MNSFLETHQEYDGQNEVVRDMVINKCSAVVKSAIKQYKLRRKDLDPKLEREKKNKAERKRAVRRYCTFLVFYDLFYILAAVPPSA